VGPALPEQSSPAGLAAALTASPQHALAASHHLPGHCPPYPTYLGTYLTSSCGEGHCYLLLSTTADLLLHAFCCLLRKTISCLLLPVPVWRVTAYRRLSLHAHLVRHTAPCRLLPALPPTLPHLYPALMVDIADADRRTRARAFLC